MGSNMEIFYCVDIKRAKFEALIQPLIEYNEAKLKTAETIPVKPFEVEITEGSRLYDVVGFQDVSNFAISEKLHNLLQDNSITGWKAYEVSIREVDKVYYGLQITGRCGKLDQPKEEGFYTGMKFNYNTWDKSDIFVPEGTLLTFCTSKVRDLLIKNKITNIAFTDINKAMAFSLGY